MTRLTGGLLAVALVAAAGCATLADRMPIDKKSLYDRLGGKPAIAAVVDDFIGNVAADARINRRFEGADIPRLKGLLVAHEKSELLGALGGMKGQIVGR